MKVIRKIEEMQKIADEYRLADKKIGFVPTMGYLHEGHLSLMEAATEKSDVLAVSIFVNPTQFSPDEDLEEYPRDIERDEKRLAEIGCDVLFYPTEAMMYPSGYKTYVIVEDITQKLCGTSRPTHFRGVTTVVTKLFNIIKPHVAVFGQKDAQQAIVIKKMVKDLNMDIEIVTAPIVREADGLAMSSRNIYLSEAEREDALSLNQSLNMVKQMIENGERDANLLKRKIQEMINVKSHTKIDYVSIVDTNNLEEVENISGEVLIALAVFVGKTRLIDNVMVDVEQDLA
jgi:pantoate--beta-alanine ligase